MVARRQRARVAARSRRNDAARMPTPSLATTLSSAVTGSCSVTAWATASGSKCTKRRGWRETADGALAEGAVVTIEPGIYRPGWGGVRIEDDVYLGPDGPEILTQFPARADRARLTPSRATAPARLIRGL